MSTAISHPDNDGPSSPLMHQQQQQQQRRRCVATPIATPRPESSPGISKLWMSASPRGIATPRRVLSYHTASSPTSPPSSPRQLQKRRRRRILLTGLVGISTWIYVSIAYFAVSQWYFLEGEKDDIGHNNPLNLRPGRTVGLEASFSFQPSKSGATKVRGKHNSEPTLETLPVKQQDEPAATESTNSQPRIVLLDDSFAFPDKEPRVPNHFLLLPKRHTTIRSTMKQLLPLSHNHTDRGESAVDQDGGMGFQDIMRGTNSTPSDDGDTVATEEKSFAEAMPNENTTASMATTTDHHQGVSDNACEPMQDWQTKLLSTCNTFHELDWFQPTFLAQGWFRDTWKYDDEIVLKTLRWEREYLDEYYELHRRDAIAMEHLTFSPFVLDIFGHCGQSAFNEFASGVGDINSLETLDRRLRGKESQSWGMKLRVATSIAVGLVHVHYGPPNRSKNMTLDEVLEDTDTPASMAHYDINPRNIAITTGGRPKINDFNVAEFLTVGSDRNNNNGDDSNHCGRFRSRLHDPWWRAPEEMNLNGTTFVGEKVDVYALGNVLFHILTTHSPRGKMKKERASEVREAVTHGARPSLIPPYDKAEKKNPVVVAFRRAMDLCYEADPAKRGTAKQVAKVLHDAYQGMLSKQ